jgi:hypothetical protein
MRMNHKIKDAIGRNTEVCFYDVTKHHLTMYTALRRSAA